MGESTSRPRRGNGEGSLTYDETRGRWRGAVSWVQPDGTLKRQAFASKTKAVVRKKMTAAQARVGGWAPPCQPADAGRVPHGVARRRAGAGQGRQRGGTGRATSGSTSSRRSAATRLADLQPRDVERLTADMVERGLSPRTAVGVRVSLRKALGDAERDGLVGRNVAALARPPRVPGREVDYLTKDELRRLLDACADDAIGPLVTVAALTGLRQGELLGLSWADLDTDAATLTGAAGAGALVDGARLGTGRAQDRPEPSHASICPRRPSMRCGCSARRQDEDREAAGPDVWQDTARPRLHRRHRPSVAELGRDPRLPSGCWSVLACARCRSTP